MKIMLNNIEAYIKFHCEFYEKEINKLTEKMYPTLESYYQLLPKEIRENPGVIAMYLNLEKKAPYWDLETK